MTDATPTANAIELIPKNAFAKALNWAMNKEWFKRFGVKLSVPLAAATTGWLAAHGGQQYAEAVAAGVGAGALFLWEAIWSWVQHKVNVVRIVKANEMETPTSKFEAIITAKEVLQK